MQLFKSRGSGVQVVRVSRANRPIVYLENLRKYRSCFLIARATRQIITIRAARCNHETLRDLCA